MRILLAVILSLGLCSAASANSGGGGGGGGHGGGGGGSSSGSGNRFLTLFTRSDRDNSAEEEATLTDDPRVFTLPAVVAPLSVNGHLTGYAYVRVHVRAANGQNVWTMQENAHYALDAMVRAAARTSLATADGSQIDHELASQVWTGVLREYYGATAVDTVLVIGDDRRMFGR